MPNRLIAHLAHVEILTPRPDESLRFFQDVIGLDVSARSGQSVFLRAWGEWNHHSLQLTEAAEPGLGHIGWRAWGEEQLATAVTRLEANGAGEGWAEGSTGHGAAYNYRSPGGQRHEIFWENELYQAPPELASPYPDRPQRYVPRGIAPRQIDHVTVLTDDPVRDAEWHRDTLGSTFTEYTMLNEESDIVVFAMSTNNEKSHDLGLIFDHSGTKGRVHHFAWWVDSREELLRAADILLNADTPIEFGPGRHGMGEQDYLYFREPGGMRVEINTGGYRLYIPDWETKRWLPSQGSNMFYKNLSMPDSMMQGFPSPQGPAPDESGVNPWSTANVH